jgi:hypothetical protein
LKGGCGVSTATSHDGWCHFSGAGLFPSTVGNDGVIIILILVMILILILIINLNLIILIIAMILVWILVLYLGLWPNG